MTVEELIQKLQVFPSHYSVEALLICPESGDMTAEIQDVSNVAAIKIVSIELATQLIPEK